LQTEHGRYHAEMFMNGGQVIRKVGKTYLIVQFCTHFRLFLKKRTAVYKFHNMLCLRTQLYHIHKCGDDLKHIIVIVRLEGIT